MSISIEQTQHLDTRYDTLFYGVLCSPNVEKDKGGFSSNLIFYDIIDPQKYFHVISVACARCGV